MPETTPNPSPYDEHGKRHVGYRIDKHSDFDYEGKVREKLDEIIRVADQLLTTDGIAYDPEKAILETTISLLKPTDNGHLRRRIKVERWPHRVSFEATDTDSMSTRGISSSLTEEGFSQQLFLRDCEQLPINHNDPEDVAALLDISTGRFDIQVSVSTSATLQSKTDFPEINAPWN